MGNGMVVECSNRKAACNLIWEKDCKLLQDAVGGKPEDGSDVSTSLQASLEEVVKLRKLVNAICKGIGELYPPKDEDGPESTEMLTSEEEEPEPKCLDSHPRKVRAAVCGFQGKEEGYVDEAPSIQNHDISEEVKNTLNQVVLSSILFAGLLPACRQELVKVFEPVQFSPGENATTQGEEEDYFYVVEYGKLSVFIKSPNSEEIKYIRDYGPGDSFGELALMYNNPRAATVKAIDKCQLWCVSRTKLRNAFTHVKSKEVKKKVALLEKVRIGQETLGKHLSSADILHLAEALEFLTFTDGYCIVRQKSVGEVFYIIYEGTVRIEVDDIEVGILQAGEYFGERALLSEEVRAASCFACGTVSCLMLSKKDFEQLLGSLSDIMVSATHVKHVRSLQNEVEKELGGGKGDSAKEDPQTPSSGMGVDSPFSQSAVNHNELEMKHTLGRGAFGSVKLVFHKPSGVHYALKCLAKKNIVTHYLQNRVRDEILILRTIRHPFVVNLHNTSQDDHCVYLVLELLEGGDMYSHLKKNRTFNEMDVRFYSASVVEAFSYIHGKNIAYRDVKPENLVLDSKGYVKLVDFGMAKVIPSGLTWTICGTPDYLAPEVLLNTGHDMGVDYWGLGVFIYEMITGDPPFNGHDDMTTYKKIVKAKFHLPRMFSEPLKNIMKSFLQPNKSKRLGITKGRCDGIKEHRWYNGFDWKGLMNQNLTPPFKPDTNNKFECVPDNELDFNNSSMTTSFYDAPPTPKWDLDIC